MMFDTHSVGLKIITHILCANRGPIFWPFLRRSARAPTSNAVRFPEPLQSTMPFSRMSQGKKKHIKIKKFGGLSRDWVGAKNLFMRFFWVIPYGGEKHINKIPPKIPGQSHENFVYVFFLYVFFRPPN